MSFNRGFFNTTIQALLAGLVVLIIVLKRMKSPRKSGNRKKQLPLPPGPAGWPVIGSIPEMLKNRPVFRWLLTLMKQYNTEIACIRLGNTHVIPVTCPVIAREMFKQQDAIFASRPLSFAQSILSNGYKTCVITPFGDQFKKMRKVVMTEIVCPARHRWLNDKRSEEADHLTAWVHNLVGKSTPVDFRFVTRHYCGNVIKRLMFGKRYFGESAPEGGPGKDDVRHMEAMFDGLGYTFAFCVSDYIPALTGLDLNGHEKIMREACATMDEYHDPIVDERIKMWGEGKRDEIQDFLDVFISLKDKDGNPLLTADEIKPEIKELVMAAPDNPSNAVEWAMAEMMNKPEILQKAVEEIDTVVGKHRLVTESDIPKLNYVKACLREAFRLHPVAAFNLPHVALSDTTVAGKYSIPKGSHVLLSRYGLGRNPKTWSDPLQFKPERHLSECSEVTLTENDLRFISFGTGRRGCAAPALGTAITVMLFARLLQGFTWRLPEATRVELVESSHDLFLAKPLVMLGEPRLPDHLYPKVKQN